MVSHYIPERFNAHGLPDRSRSVVRKSRTDKRLCDCVLKRFTPRSGGCPSLFFDSLVKVHMDSLTVALSVRGKAYLSVADHGKSIA